MSTFSGLADLHDFPLILLYIVTAAIVVFVSLKLSDFLNIIDKKSNISGAFLGGVLLAAVTSLPELFSSLTATVFVKNNDYVLGNVLGSNLFNMMIFAIVFFVFFKKMAEKKVSKYFLISMAFCGALYVLTTIAGLVFVPLHWLFGYFNPMSIVIVAVYVISIIKTPKIEEAEEEEEKEGNMSLKTATILFTIFAVVLVGASIFLTYLTDGISEKYHLGASFGGALFLGVATSLPELTSTINLARKKNFQAAYSDLIGSCIFNFLILTFSDVLSFGCRTNVYHFDQSAFMMVVFGAVEFVALLIALILLIKGVDSSKLCNRIMFYVLGAVLVGSYIAFIVLSNVNLGIPFAPFIK
ncbi:MAG: sodium:calcium antiporter [Bacilli bacterium]|nr:sodium:calcium antiporter [Bacilli bacterium]